MGTQGTGRKRSTKKERSTAEDDALNLIAREAEARLAAKRAARAEAREIRMKELERQQKELSDEDERMSVGSRGSVRVEDRDYLEKGSRAASALTAGTLTSLGGTSSRRGSGETALTVDAESSIREIKEIHELKDQIQDVETKYSQNLKEAKDALAEVEEKYRKAMVSNAQLDNEKNNLMYQVDTLKDSLMELEELLSESRREYEEKVKEYEREKHAHGVLQFQFNEMKETLKQSEELLNDIRQLRMKQDGFVREISDLQETVEWKDKKIGALERQKEYTDAIRIERDELREEVVQLKDILKKHGIVLGPDLNINGDVGDSEVDGSPGADPASRSAQDSQTSPTEGNSMLGNTEETELRSSREEEVDPEQQQEMLQEVKENHLSSEIDSLNSTLCNVADVDTSSEKQLSEEQRANLPTAEDGIRQSGLSEDLTVDIHDGPTTEAKDVIVCSSEPQHIHPVRSPEEIVSETEISEGENLKETRYSDLGETETKNNSVDTHSDVRDTCTNLHEEQDNKQEGVEESDLSNTKPCPQQKATQDVMKESVCDESVPALSNTEPQQRPENADEADNIEAEEIPSKSASGKKKKKKKKGKKKGGTQDNKNQQKDGTNKENKTDKDEESAAGGSVTETIEKSQVDQVKKEQDKQETVEADAVEPTEPTKTFTSSEAVKEPRTDHLSNENDEKQIVETKTLDDVEEVNLSVVNMDQLMDKQNEELTLETETVESVEAVEHTESFSYVDTLKETRTDSNNNGQDEEQTLETETVESVEAVEPPAETLKETRTESNSNGQDEEQTPEMETVESVEAVEPPAETLKETRTESNNNGQDEEQTLETETVESVEAVEPPAETFKETRTESNNNGQDEEQTPEMETVESVEAVEPPAETLTEFGTDSKKNERDDKLKSETENEEQCETIPSLDPEASLCKSNFNSKSTESTDGLGTKTVDDSESEVLCAKSEIVDQVEAEVESTDEMKPECTTEKPEYSLETCSKESTEAESHISSNDDVAANESEFINSSESKDNTSVSPPSTEDFNDDFKSLSESEPSAAVNLGNDDPPVKDSDQALEEATEAVADDEDAGADMDEECIHQGRTAREDLNRDLKEAGDLVEPDCALHDEKSDKAPSSTNTTEALDSGKSLKAAVQNEQLNDAESKISECMDPVEESNAEEKTEEINTNVALDTPEYPKEAAENGSDTEQETDVQEDSDLKDSQHVKESELSLCTSDEQPHDSKDKCENDDLSHPTQLLSDEDDDGEDDEGMSFDFDDMDMEAAVVSDLPKNSEQEEVEEGVEVMFDETISDSSGLCQSNSQSNENTQVKPVESNDEKCTVDRDNQVDALDQTSNTAPQETQNSLVDVEAASEVVENVCEEEKNTLKEEAGVADDQSHIAEEGTVLSVGGLGAVAESIKQTVCSLVEEGLDAVRSELQGEDSDLPKSTDQVESNKEAPQPGRDVKKSSKKGKGKGKEDCKMS